MIQNLENIKNDFLQDLSKVQNKEDLKNLQDNII